MVLPNNLKATHNGRINKIPDCYIVIPTGGGGEEVIQMQSLPDISDSKTANYNNEAVIGRSFPLYTYSYSGDRTISLNIHFFVVDRDDIAGPQSILNKLRLIQSAVYPRQGIGGEPFRPPPVCRIKCGELLAKDELCVILRSYTVRFPTDVVWYTDGTFTPFRLDIDTQWAVVYPSRDLPFQDRIIRSGR